MTNILRSEQFQKGVFKSVAVLFVAFFPFMLIMAFFLPDNSGKYYKFILDYASFVSHYVPVIKILSIGSFSPDFTLVYGAMSATYIVISILVPSLLMIFGFSGNTCAMLKRYYPEKMNTDMRIYIKSWTIGALMILVAYILPYISWFPMIGFLNGARLSKDELISGIGGGTGSFDVVMLSLYHSRLALFIFYSVSFGWLMLFLNSSIIVLLVAICKSTNLYRMLNGKEEV
ncbi:hypothetical protein ACSDBR_09365 [Acidithiobacillus ferriphilus]|uniref:hypothetical protein n=1 Tax=Acidithiobacillus ferriphilus TaxID=1689834 RepID=UPI003F518727